MVLFHHNEELVKVVPDQYKVVFNPVVGTPQGIPATSRQGSVISLQGGFNPVNGTPQGIPATSRQGSLRSL